MRLAFDIPPVPPVPVAGQDLAYPVGRIFCVGRNYAAHAAEMGAEVDRSAPFYFTKSPAALVIGGGVLPYPPGTADLHHEVELVVAIGAALAGADREAAAAAVYGHACGLDLTRRDLQQIAKDNRRPWDLGKDFEGAAVVGPITAGPVLPAPGRHEPDRCRGAHSAPWGSRSRAGQAGRTAGRSSQGLCEGAHQRTGAGLRRTARRNLPRGTRPPERAAQPAQCS